MHAFALAPAANEIQSSIIIYNLSSIDIAFALAPAANERPKL